jgi:hypothetical protein
MFARGAIVAFGVALSFVGCSRQGEGERCVFEAAGNTDCDDGLFCIPCRQLRGGTVDRCCPRDPGAESDVDCQRADADRPPEACGIVPPTGGTGGQGGIGGQGGTSGQSGSSGQGGSSGTSGEGGAADMAGAGGA